MKETFYTSWIHEEVSKIVFKFKGKSDYQKTKVIQKFIDRVIKKIFCNAVNRRNFRVYPYTFAREAKKLGIQIK